MPHCTQCGATVAADARFCPSCGGAQPASGTPMTPVSQSGLSENVAALLSYVLGWLTGLIFFLVDRRPFVRFHAAQSLVTFGGLHILQIVLGIAFGLGWAFGGSMVWGWGTIGLGAGLLAAIRLLTFILWIVCMVKAYQGVRFKLPLAGDVAENAAGR